VEKALLCDINDSVSKSEQVVELAGNIGLDAVQLCMSKHAQRRIASLFIKVLKCALVSNEQIEVLDGLCYNFCQLMVVSHKAGNAWILDKCFNLLRCTILNKEDLSSRVDESFQRILQNYQAHLEGCASCYSGAGTWAVCLSVISFVRCRKNIFQSNEDYLSQVFIQNAVFQQFAPPYEISLARHYIRGLKQSIVDVTLVPTLSKKLRASPESVLETVLSLLSELGQGDDKIEFTKQVETDVIPCVLKLLLSAKEDLRTMASNTLIQISKFRRVDSVVLALASAIGPKTSKTTGVSVKLTSSAHRTGGYLALYEIGKICLSNENGKSECLHSETNLGNVVDATCEALVLSLTKETDKEAKESASILF